MTPLARRSSDPLPVTGGKQTSIHRAHYPRKPPNCN